MKNLLSNFTRPSTAKIVTLTSLAASFAFVANPAQAAIFNVGGTNYDITTVTGSYNDLQTQLQATPWFGSQTKAESFATAVKGDLGTQFGGGIGPMFAFDYFLDFSLRGQVSSSNWRIVGGFAESYSRWYTGTTPYQYAVAVESVPEPLTILGAITATGFGVAFKRKLAKSTKDQKDA